MQQPCKNPIGAIKGSSLVSCPHWPKTLSDSYRIACCFGSEPHKFGLGSDYKWRIHLFCSY